MNDHPKRTNLSKKIRFEVFKRDSFTCQYCGRKAPDIALQCDHVEPVSKGGTNDILNLLTSCVECNIGKSNRRLSDNTILSAKHKLLAESQERKEQIEMMFQWQKELLAIDDHAVNQLGDFWCHFFRGCVILDDGKADLHRMLHAYSIDEIINAMKIAKDRYIEYSLGVPTETSINEAWKRLSGICHLTRADKEKPLLKQIYYIRGILRNRLQYCDENKALYLLKTAVNLRVSIESLEEHAKTVKDWSQWCHAIEQFISNPGGAE